MRALSADLRASHEEICYVGDSRRDAEAFAEVGLALAAADASESARVAAHRVLTRGRGAGAVEEAVDLILAAHGSPLPKRV